MTADGKEGASRAYTDETLQKYAKVADLANTSLADWMAGQKDKQDEEDESADEDYVKV